MLFPNDFEVRARGRANSQILNFEKISMTSVATLLAGVSKAFTLFSMHETVILCKNYFNKNCGGGYFPSQGRALI